MTAEITQQDAVVATFDTHIQAEEAVKRLEAANVDMKQLSIVGRDYHTEEHAVGYYNTGDRMKYWGKLGAFWGGIWGLLFGSGIFWLPGIGPLIVAGPLVGALVGALENAVVSGGFSALGAAIYSIGIPKDSIVQYESTLKAGKFLLMVHGTPADVAAAKRELDKTQATAVEHHESKESG